MKEILAELGLSKKETAVLMALLELGASTVSTIATRAKLNRTTAYDILESLRSLGLISPVGDKAKKMYVAEPPDTLVSYLEKRSQEFSSKAQKMKEVLPQLRALYSDKGIRPRIRYYEGKEGLETVYEDTLTTSEPILAYASVGDMHTVLPHYFPKYYQRRAGRKIHIRAILPATPDGIERAKHDYAEDRESRLVDPTQFNFSPEINIYDNKVAIMSLAEEFGVIIESEEIAEAQKKIFELAWRGTQVSGIRSTIE